MIYNTLDCVSITDNKRFIKIEKELAAANSALVDANKEIDRLQLKLSGVTETSTVKYSHIPLLS